MTINKALKLFKGAETGTTVVEFALIFPVFVGMIVGSLYACIGLFTAGSLEYAVQKGARCASVSATNCPSSATTIAYTTASYHGPVSPAPTFTYATGACGYTVTGSVNFDFNFGLSSVNVPITASACYP